MKPKSLGIIAILAVVAVVAVAAVAFGPSSFSGLGNPESTTRFESPIGVPTWHVGDTWTYDVNESLRSMNFDHPYASGTLTRAVVSADAEQYNVSVAGSFHLVGLLDRMNDPSPANATIMLYHHPMLDNATVDGYAWYRASDLAKVKDVRTVRVYGSLWTEAGVFNASYTATVETTYQPALDIWSFPLGENETWNVTSNATIHAQIQWGVVGPDIYWDFGRNISVTVPIRLVLRSGVFDNVTTPAGTFASILVRAGFAAFERDTDDHRDMAIQLGNDEAMEHRLPAALWFSGTAKNVVMTSVVLGGVRVEAVLASYHVG